MVFNWKKTLIIVVDVVIAVYLVMAATVFNRPVEKATVCSEVKIDIAQGSGEGFLNPAEVKRLLERQQLYPLNQPLQFVSTRQIEETLEKSPFVDQAECYKTQSGHVCIALRQRLPVLHVMPSSGERYYLDDHGDILPATGLTTDLIVATGAISRNYAQRVLAPLANSLRDDKFWQNQIVQLNVLGDGSLELVPRVGDHIAYLGAPTDIPEKLDRLRKFYKYGLSHAGWNRYERISVEFGNQIICKKRKGVKRS
jgi:cell division protein FtsQ